jgi:S-DNA-T family DNA segregation ATPase FtsK/SpoIIIE
MSHRLHVELEVARPDSDVRTIRLTAPGDVSAGAALDAVGAHLGLSTAAGAVQGRSLICGSWIDRSARLDQVGLLRGERLSVAVGLSPPLPPGPLHRWPGVHQGDDAGTVAVNRPPRSVQVQPGSSLPVPTRRTVRAPRRFPLGTMLIPLFIGVLLVVVTKRWEVALFSLFTPVMVAWNHFEERRAHADEVDEQGRTYAEDVETTTTRIRAVTADWAQWLHRYHPDPGEVTAIAEQLSPRLWERQPGDPDFLRLRLGRSSLRAPIQLRDTNEGTRSSDPEARAGYDAAAVAADVPAVVDLGGAGLLAVLGSDDVVDRCTAWLTAQLTTLHSPADLMIVAALSDPDSAAWFRWLPHLGREEVAVEPIATERRQADALLAAVAEIGARRRAAADGRGRGPVGDPVLVVVVDDRLGADPSLLHAVIGCRDVGVVTLWIGTDARAVPTASPFLLTLDTDGRRGELIGHRGGDRFPVVPELLPRATMLDLSAALAPLRDAADARRVRSVPERLSLEDLIDGLTSPVAIRRRWDDAPITHLSAVLGMSADGPVALDLGPNGSHVLVGGTTGSGKSELLQTMVTAIAAAYPPSRVGFLLVDYKGGAAFKDAMRLPHCVGVVTDLDLHLTRRVMQALDAEIRRREELLAEVGARDLTELRRVNAADAPGDLVIVVDEFATLAKEIPEFVEGVVDIAARGRSLGLRLVLATQRPAGVVSDRIRANVGVRIALRVNDEEDSRDVVDDRAAAHIPRDLPGRAFLKVHRELDEFQSAYVGSPVRRGSTAAIEVRDLHGPPVAASGQAGPSVLESVSAACHQVMGLGRWKRPHVPWLPAMPDVVTAADLADLAPDVGVGRVRLALADLPQQQAQRVVVLDLERHQNLLVFGTSRSGKTTALRTVAAAFVDTHSPDQLQIYGLDFAGHGLHALERAPHCGGVVGPEDPGRIARLVRRLTAVVDQRKRAMASSGFSDFNWFAEISTAPQPRILVLLDGYASAAASLERLDGGRLLEQLERLIPAGPAAGVHFIITADRRAAVPNALTSVITTRLVLRMAEHDDYAMLGVHAALARNATVPPGRGFIQGATEVQLGVLAGAEVNRELDALTALVARAAARWPVGVAPVGVLPTSVELSDMPLPSTPWRLPVAIGDDEARPVPVDLSDGHLLVAGPPRSGRTSTLATIATAASHHPEPVACAVFVARRSPLSTLLAPEVGPVDATDPAALAVGIDRVDALLRRGRKVLCLCDDVDELSETASQLLESLAQRGRDEPVRLVAATDNRTALRAYSGLVPELRKAKQGLLLSPDVELDGDLLGVRLRPPLERPGGPGRGFLVSGGVAELVQVARPLTDLDSSAAEQPDNQPT